MTMKSDIDLLRKILLLSYHLLDEKEYVKPSEIMGAPELRQYGRQAIIEALDEAEQCGYIERESMLWDDDEFVVIDVTYDGFYYMKGKKT